MLTICFKNTKDDILGYAIDTLYVSNKHISYFFKGIKEDVIIRYLPILMSREISDSLVEVLNVDNYKEIFDSWNSLQNIELADIVFIPIPIKILAKKFFTKYLFELKGSKGYGYIIYSTKDSCDIGYLVTDTDLYDSDTLYIKMLELSRKSEGYGSKIINHLKHLNKNLCGLAISQSKGFWKRQGADFTNEVASFHI